MKILKLANTKAGMIVALAAVAGVAVYVAQKKAAEMVGDVGHAINPVNNDNIFAAGVDNVGAKLTGDDGFKLGIWLYDKFNESPDVITQGVSQ